MDGTADCKLKIQKEAVLGLLKDSIEEAGLVNFEIFGESMYPFLRVDDRVLVKHISPQELKPGDIVAYRVSGDLLSHRFIYSVKKEGSPSGFITKGDNAVDFDPYIVLPGQILGKVICIERRGVKINLEEPFWRAISSFIGGLSCFEAYLAKAFRYLKNIFLKKAPRLPLKQIVAFPFLVLMKFTTTVACLFTALRPKNTDTR